MKNPVEDALKTIRGYQETQTVASRWRLEIPVWRMVGEGLAMFALAFLVGLGLGIIYNIIATFTL